MISLSAQVAPTAIIDDTAQIWDLAQVRENAEVGADVIIGRGVYVGTGVKIGEKSKIQNYALIYEPAVIAVGVFIGPAVVLTNDRNPRAVNPDGSRKEASDWNAVGVTVEEGASIGARTVCVAPVRIGAWSLIAAGSVIISDVPEFALMAGVPARQIGWVGRHGMKLIPSNDNSSILTCPESSALYEIQDDGKLIQL